MTPAHVSAAELLRLFAAQLAGAGGEDPRREARLLLAHALGVDPQRLILAPDQAVPAAAAEQAAALVARRGEQREPISRLIGRRGFWTLDLAVTPDTLDPRPDSETVIEAVLAARPDQGAALRILDLGTGSGCLLLALLSEYPAAWGLGLDLNPGAARAAQDNARRCGLADRAAFVVGRWGQALARESFDVVVSNPPYIPTATLPTLAPEVRDHDPPLALDGGADGLDCYRALAPEIRRLLRPGGLVVVEIGQGQEGDVSSILHHAGFEAITPKADLGTIVRCLSATTPNGEKT